MPLAQAGRRMSGRAVEGFAQEGVVVADAVFVAGAEGAAVEDAGLHVGLRALADREVLADDIAGPGRGAAVALHRLRRGVGEEEVVVLADAARAERHDARDVHAAR